MIVDAGEADRGCVRGVGPAVVDVLNRPGFLGGSEPWKGRSRASEEVQRGDQGAGGPDGVPGPPGVGAAQGAIAVVADKLGVNRETLRNWVKHAEVDGGRRPGTSTVDTQRIAEVENRELRRANEILKAASAFFARELDPRPPR